MTNRQRLGVLDPIPRNEQFIKRTRVGQTLVTLQHRYQQQINTREYLLLLLLLLLFYRTGSSHSGVEESPGRKHKPEMAYVYWMYNCVFFSSFGNISSCSHLCSKRRVGWAPFDRRAHVAGILGAIRAVCRAWQAF